MEATLIGTTLVRQRSAQDLPHTDQEDRLSFGTGMSPV